MKETLILSKLLIKLTKKKEANILSEVYLLFTKFTFNLF